MRALSGRMMYSSIHISPNVIAFMPSPFYHLGGKTQYLWIGDLVCSRSDLEILKQKKKYLLYLPEIKFE